MTSKPSKLQVVIPMSGTGERFRRAGYKDPKPLIHAGEESIISNLVKRFPRDSRFVFICNEEHLRTAEMAGVLGGVAADVTLVPISPHKRGPVHAVLEASPQIQDHMQTIVNYCDFSFVWDAEQFLEWANAERVDGAIVCYRGFHPHYFGPTNYAYCKTDEFGSVLEIREKQNFTLDRTREFASSGTYYFRSGGLAKKYFRENIQSGLAINGEYYVSLVFNHLIRDQLNVRVFEIPIFLQWGTPEDLEDWKHWEAAFRVFPKKSNEAKSPRMNRSILLMPMAGLGERFRKDGVSKPLIDLHMKPLFQMACQMLPETAKRVFVYRKEVETQVRQALRSDDQSVILAEPTDGQAATCAMAECTLRALPDGPIWISACDHGLALSQADMMELERSNCDMAAVGVRGFPGARRSPQSFAYIDARENLSSIKKVSVKVPLSESPQKDWLLVGTFYFRSKDRFLSLLRELLVKNVRVNGERYLDSIVNLAIEDGLDARVLGSSAYYCWGTPDFLNEYRYWHRYFKGFNA